MPQFIIDFIAESGGNPFQVFIVILQNGGLVIFFPLLVWMCWKGWHIWIQEKYIHKKKYVLLAIDVPKLTEQNMKAIEQIITAMHGVHFSPNKKEAHWIGVVQDRFSLEIVSIDGYIQYFVRCDNYNAELVKGAIFAQYPDAEIIEVEDYVTNVPTKFPNETHDMWGCEFILAKTGAFPIKTYEHFEHSLSGVFADPVAAILEAMSRIYPGEHVWLQIVITPEGHHWQEHAQHDVDKVAGKPEHATRNILDRILDAPLAIVGAILDQIFPNEAAPQGPTQEEKSNFMALTTGEKIVVEEMQKKLARLVFETKFRFIYLGPKGQLNVYRVGGPIFGAVKQFNAMDLNSFTVGGLSVTSGPTYYMVQRRLNRRKSFLMHAYKHRSNEEGEAPYIMSTAEIATIFHFPSEMVRAPLVSKTESKKAEPPARLPLENSPFVTLRRTPVAEPAPVVTEPVAVSGASLHSMPGLPPGVRPVRQSEEPSATAQAYAFVPPPPPPPAAVEMPQPLSSKGAAPPNLPFA